MLKTGTLFSQRRSRYIQKLPFFYGWVIVFLGALTMFATTPGQSDTFSLFMDSYIHDFGWSRTFVSSLYAIATLLSGLLMFLVGRIIDRLGSKWVAILSAIVLGIACILLSAVTSPLTLFIGIFLARLAGKGSLDLSASTLIPQWFIKRRALTIMLVGLGGTFGGMVFPLLNSYLIQTFGWREAYRYLGAGLWLIYVPIILLFLINRPENIGMLPDGGLQAANTSTAENLPESEPSLQQKQALKTPAFWIISFCAFQASLVGTGIILHFISIFDQQGLSMAFAARIIGAKTLIGFITTVAAGILLDRVKRQHLILAAALLLQVIGITLLAWMQTAPMAYLYAVISGIAGGLVSLSLGVLKPNLFGRRYLGGIAGVTMAIDVIGSAIGPIAFGAAFDLIHGYQQIILLSAVLPLLAGVLSLFIRKPALMQAA